MRPRPGRGLLAFCAALLTAGCTTLVSGGAVPARDSAGIIGIGRSIVDLLPTDAELSRVLKSPIHHDDFPPSVGGLTVLSNWLPQGADPECVSVIHPSSRRPYQGSTARAVAKRSWMAIHDDFWLDVGVVAMASPHDAREQFARFVSQWQHCEGKSEVREQTQRITNVGTLGPTVTAVVVLTTAHDDVVLPNERAIGLAYNCIVDVEVDPVGAASHREPSAGRAHAVAELMMAKAGA